MRRLASIPIALCVALAVLELVARAFSAPQLPGRVYDPFAWRINAPGHSEPIATGSGSTFDLRFNDLGMRGPDSRAPLPPGTLTLVFLGGSTTENAAFDAPDTFPEISGRELGAMLGRPVRVFNAGTSGATSNTTLARVQQQVLDLEPSAIVVLDGINDLLAGFHPAFRPDGRHLAPPPTADALPRSYLYAWLRTRRVFARLRPLVPRAEFRRADYADFPARHVFARNLRSLAAITEARDLPLLLLVQPSAYHDPPEPGDAERFFLRDSLVDTGKPVPDVPSLIAGMRAFDDAVRTLPHAARVQTVDLEALLPKTREVFLDECHFTREGNRRVAAAIVPALATLLRARTDPPAP